MEKKGMNPIGNGKKDKKKGGGKVWVGGRGRGLGEGRER